MPNKWLFVTIISVIFSFIMSAIMTFVFVGASPVYLNAWMQDWAVAFVIGFILNSFLPARIQRFVAGKSHPLLRTAATGALIYTIILSFALVSYALRGWSNPNFLNIWLLHAWPVALVSAFVVNLFLPRLVGRLVAKITA
ncbi:MAG TPA: DUF2798 domain-containing protein [Lactobacillaceae bacterium]|jgi:hypothetical protein